MKKTMMQILCISLCIYLVSLTLIFKACRRNDIENVSEANSNDYSANIYDESSSLVESETTNEESITLNDVSMDESQTFEDSQTSENDMSDFINEESVEDNILDDTIMFPDKPVDLYTEEDLYVLSHLIFAEAGGCSWEHRVAVGSVVLNRVKDERFPNTIKEVVFQKGQYACTWDGNYEKEPDQEAIEIAMYLLENGSQLPPYVIFQSEFLQGDSVYKKIWNTYFCYWSEDVKKYEE